MALQTLAQIKHKHLHTHTHKAAKTRHECCLEGGAGKVQALQAAGSRTGELTGNI